MGFRVPYINVSSAGNTASAVLNLIGTKYLILVIDDYNQNHINNGLVSIAEYSKTLKLPSYYSPDLPYVCSRALPTETNIQILINNNPDNGILIADKLNEFSFDKLNEHLEEIKNDDETSEKYKKEIDKGLAFVKHFTANDTTKQTKTDIKKTLYNNKDVIEKTRRELKN
jgi:hypothetical protein